MILLRRGAVNGPPTLNEDVCSDRDIPVLGFFKLFKGEASTWAKENPNDRATHVQLDE